MGDFLTRKNEQRRETGTLNLRLSNWKKTNRQEK